MSKDENTTKEEKLIDKITIMDLNQLNNFINTKDNGSLFTLKGHYDSIIVKCTVKALYDLFYPKYEDESIMSVDEILELCPTSIERIKSNVLAFPEFVNKTLTNREILFIPIDKEGETVLLSSNEMVTDVDVEIKIFISGKNHEKYMKVIKNKISEQTEILSKIAEDREILKEFSKLNYKGRTKVFRILQDYTQILEYTKELPPVDSESLEEYLESI